MIVAFLYVAIKFAYSDEVRYEKLLEEQVIIKNLLENPESYYDWRVRPSGSLGNFDNDDPEPIFITVNMYLRSISKIDDVNMEYSLHFTFREEWIDERLYFNSSTLKHIVLSPGQKIWVPDTFFQNEKFGKKHDVDTPNILIRVHNGTGRILYSCRLTLTLSCPMRLADYPLDVQICVVDFASYAYTTKDITYGWKEEKPIQIKEGLRKSLPSFLLSDVRTGNCTSITNTGAYSCLRTIIELKREFSYYLLQLYIPSFMLVAVSWVSFWLDKDSVPARVTLGVTTLLTMTTQASGVNANLPPVSYTKAIDIWIGVCLAFIFGALLEFALVNWAARKDVSMIHRKRQNPLLYKNETVPEGGDFTIF
ncbi:Glutamate-gated chloride channel alpha, partial [Parelaphostrongylus tenuis]